jgi:hypothetical protein
MADATKVKSAENLLRELLANTAMCSKDVFAHMEAAGHAPVTVRRAKKRLGVKSDRVSDDGAGGGSWLWSLPQGDQVAADQAQDDQSQGDQAPSAPIAGLQGDHPAGPPLSQGAQSEASQGDQSHGNAPQGDQPPPRRKREIKVCRDPAGPDQISHEQWRELGCDKDRLREFIHARDAERKASNVEAA